MCLGQLHRCTKLIDRVVGLIITVILLSNGAANADIQIFDENAKVGDAFSTSKGPKGWLQKATTDWMKMIPNNVKLHKISIPGTHDSGALYGGIAVATQAWSIEEQLRAEIRFLDIRARPTKTAFAIHHGPFYQKQMFGDVMNTVTAFLRDHPSEVILMRVKEEHTPEKGSETFHQIWKRYVERFDLFVWNNGGREEIPAIGTVRGKIVVLRNNGGIPKENGLSYSESTIQDKYKVWWLAHKMDNGDNVSLPFKKGAIKKHIRIAEREENTELVLNHLSGSVGMLPRDVERATNRETYRYIGDYNSHRTLGTLIMDFPGDKLIYRIIKSNLSSTKICNPKSYVSRSDHTWVEFELPRVHVGRVISIKAGAYNKYVFPKCNRVVWSDLSFLCQSNGQWKRTKGSWDADAWCHGSKGNSPYVRVGTR